MNFVNILLGAAYVTGKTFGRSKRAIEQLKISKQSISEAFQQGLVFYGFIPFSIYLLRQTTVDNRLPSQEKIKRKYSRIFPTQVADVFVNLISHQNALFGENEIERIGRLLRNRLKENKKNEFLRMLIYFVRIDSVIETKEIEGLRYISISLGISPQAFDDLINMYAPHTSVIDSSYFYNLLGIDKEASPKQIHKAYRLMSAKYHPDKYVNQSEEEQRAAKEKFIKIGEAYQRIKG